MSDMQSPSDIGRRYRDGVGFRGCCRSKVAACLPFRVQRPFDRTRIEAIVELAQFVAPLIGVPFFGTAIRPRQSIGSVTVLPNCRGRDEIEGTLCPGSYGIDRVRVNARAPR